MAFRRSSPRTRRSGGPPAARLRFSPDPVLEDAPHGDGKGEHLCGHPGEGGPSAGAEHRGGGESGVAAVTDFSWKQLLSADGCTKCGRCRRMPAFAAGMPCPRDVVLKTKDQLGGSLRKHRSVGDRPWTRRQGNGSSDFVARSSPRRDLGVHDVPRLHAGVSVMIEHMT